MTEKSVWHIVKEAAKIIGVAKVSPHDLRRTCARLCHASGGELEQVQFLSKAPYLARGMLHKVFALSKDKVENQRNFLSLFDELPRRRLEIRFGKFSLPDFFDLNSVGSDTHFQFTNWSVDNNGAWDYAADTRGYTVGIVADYEDRNWGFRFAEGLMPKVANGIDLVWRPWQVHTENWEYELRRGVVPKKSGVLRLLAYTNYANMSTYRNAVIAVENSPSHQELVSGEKGFFTTNTKWLVKPTLSPSQIQGIIAAVPLPHRALFVLLALTGLRIGEVLGLKWRDIDLENGRLYVRRSIWMGAEQSTKSAFSDRGQFIVGTLAKAIIMHRAVAAYTQPDNFVFSNGAGRPHYPDDLRKRVLYPAMERAGITRAARSYGFHIFRHSAGTGMLEATNNLKTTSSFLGHASIEITGNVYSHTTPEVERVAMEKLELATFPESVSENLLLNVVKTAPSVN